MQVLKQPGLNSNSKGDMGWRGWQYLGHLAKAERILDV